jgi:uncharacterized membrane protein required for colicin V production
MFDLIVILAVAVIGYMWSTRGALSSFIHLLCTVIAGAIAIAVWEPVAMLLINTGEEMAADFAWGAGLALPFVLSLVVLRVVTDKLVPGNIDVDPATNFAAGGLFGALSGILTVGLMILSVGYTRSPQDIWGYRPVQYDSNGSLVVKAGLVAPVEVWTSKFYSTLSGGLLRPIGGESLAKLRPNLAYEGALLRTSFEEGKSRITLPPSAFEVVKRYTFAPNDPKQLFADSFDAKRAQSFTNLDGTAPSAAESQIEGIVVRFKAGAKERMGSVVIGPGQMQLIVQTNPADPESKTVAVQPLAVIAMSADEKNARYGRWRFDSQDTYFRSVGGADEAPMAFEFVTPKGSKPIAVSVRGVRIDLASFEPQNFASMSARDDAINSRSLVAARASKLDSSNAVTVKVNPDDFQSAFRINNNLPWNLVFQKDVLKGMTVGGDNGREIDGGELSKFTADEMKGGGAAARELQVRNFAKTDDTTIVQLTVDRTNTQWGLLSDAAAGIDRSQGPALIDSTGTSYSPVGFAYQTSQETWLQFSPQSPITSVDGMGVGLSKSRTDQKLILIFRISRGTQIQSFAVGEKVIANFTPAVPMSR